MIDLTAVPGVLGEIGRRTQMRLAAFQEKYDRAYLVERRLPGVAPRNFAKHMTEGSYPRVIAEIKRASPSRGEIAPGVSPIEVAKSYLDAGAHALSVLTEPDYFHGDINFLRKIRERCPSAYLLMKDFYVDTFQLDQALWAGADCILLIIALTGPEASRLLFHKAQELGLSVLVEVHDQAELRVALDLKAPLIGINNRNLKDLSISLKVSEDLAKLIEPGTVIIGESGLKSRADLDRLANVGCHGFLIGSHLMASKDPGAKLRELLL